MWRTEGLLVQPSQRDGRNPFHSPDVCSFFKQQVSLGDFTDFFHGPPKERTPDPDLSPPFMFLFPLTCYFLQMEPKARFLECSLFQPVFSWFSLWEAKRSGQEVGASFRGPLSAVAAEFFRGLGAFPGRRRRGGDQGGGVSGGSPSERQKSANIWVWSWSSARIVHVGGELLGEVRQPTHFGFSIPGPFRVWFCGRAADELKDPGKRRCGWGTFCWGAEFAAGV